MNKRNSKLAVIALAITATSIGAGAMISGNAIAGADTKGGETATVSMVSADATSGEAVKCTFDDIDLPTAGNSEAGITEVGIAAGSDGGASAPTGAEQAVGSIGDGPADGLEEGAIVDGQVIHAVPAEVAGGGGFTVSVDGKVSDITAFESEAPVPAGGAPVAETGTAPTEIGTAPTEAGTIEASELADGVNVFSADEARTGTASECATMRAALPSKG